MDALEKANIIRIMRAELKRDVRAGRVSVHTYLLDPPPWLETMKVFELILSIPKYGRVKVNKIFQRYQISPSKTVGGLSDRQRALLVSVLRPK